MMPTDPAVRVLVVEDDATLGAGLVGALAAAGYEVRWVRDLMAARTGLQSASAALILLDLGLPDGDGIELCTELRAYDDAAVILVVTARTEAADAIRALDSGADDYVTKPFRTDELLARLRAHLRRSEPVAGPQVRVGLLRLDPGARRASWDGAELGLRPKEYDLLAVLAAEAGNAVRRERLMDEVWDEHWTGSTKTLDVHVANLRRKLADAGDRWDRIATLRGYGYRLDVDD